LLARNNAGVNVTASANEREVQAFWGRRAYAVAITQQNGIVLEKEARPGPSQARFMRYLPATPAGHGASPASRKFEQIDREGQIRYADATRAWTQIVEFPD
jgi:hypothetical protein